MHVDSCIMCTNLVLVLRFLWGQEEIKTKTISLCVSKILKPMCGFLALSMVLKLSVAALSLLPRLELSFSCTIHTLNLNSALSSITFVISFSWAFSNTYTMSHYIIHYLIHVKWGLYIICVEVQYVEVKETGDVSEDTCSLESGIKLDLLNHYKDSTGTEK